MEWGTSTSSTLATRRSGCAGQFELQHGGDLGVVCGTAFVTVWNCAGCERQYYTANPSAQGGGVFKLDYADAPALTFATTSVGLTDMVDGTESVVVQNIGNATLNLTTVAPPSANFSLVSGGRRARVRRRWLLGRVLHGGRAVCSDGSGQADGRGDAYGQRAGCGGSDAEGEPLRRGRFNAAPPPPAPTITAEPSNPSGTPAATFSASRIRRRA